MITIGKHVNYRWDCLVIRQFAASDYSILLLLWTTTSAELILNCDNCFEIEYYHRKKSIRIEPMRWVRVLVRSHAQSHMAASVLLAHARTHDESVTAGLTHKILSCLSSLSAAGATMLVLHHTICLLGPACNSRKPTLAHTHFRI